jgi:formylglycine-generating enzyme required for sulfatase activity/nitrate/TMAO reductase-like tetraheme cytochrome c subunit
MGKHKKNYLLAGLGGLVLGLSLMVAFNSFWVKSSSNDSCMSCHAHPESDASYKQSYHHMNSSGTKTDCAQCHLPPKGTFKYAYTKARMGIKDVWAHLTKDTESIDWSRKGELEYAQNIVFNESCKECHINLYPEGITDQGITAHLYYDDNEQKLNLQCISCHLDAGHYNPNYKHESLKDIFKPSGKIYESATEVTAFENFIETIPGTAASISMIAVPGGEFTIGSPEDEPFREDNEGPQRRVRISPFFMGEVEVTWDQFWAFYSETMSEGRTPPSVIYANNSRDDIDAVSGPTPPFGLPDQGWGMGSRPAITMTHYSAQTFCQWLSLKTGKKYRLPTEAEWEYAARGGTQTPYFFEGNPRKLSNEGFLKDIFEPDTTGIDSHVIYVNNSDNRSQEPSETRPNPFGLKNMLGNVMEYCEDWYAEDSYESITDGELDPRGPSEGTEHVVRGGHYNSDAADLRSAARSHTEHDDWLKTDPQNPKSIWWYSDVKGIGFRVVCEVPDNLK